MSSINLKATEAKDRSAFFNVRCKEIFGVNFDCNIERVAGLKHLGSGAYANVYVVSRNIKGRKYIIKIKDIENFKAGLVEYYLMQLFAKFVKRHTPHVAVPMCINYKCSKRCIFASEYFSQGTLSSMKLTDTTARQIIFQILFTLYTIQNNLPKFRHHDLHLDNILMDPIRQGVTYKLPWGVYRTTNACGPFLYDLGLANLPGHAGRYTNPLYDANLKRDWGIYPDSDVKYDHHLFFNGMYMKSDTPKSAKAFIARHIPSEYLGPNSVRVSNFRLRPGKHPKVSSLGKILKDPYFTVLKTSMNKSRYSCKTNSRKRFSTQNGVSNIFAGKLPKTLSAYEKQTMSRLIKWGRFTSNTPFNKGVRRLSSA